MTDDRGIDVSPPDNAREQMPGVTAWVDSMRESFGKETIDQAIRQGLRHKTFWALEGQYVVGSPPEVELVQHIHQLRQDESELSKE